MRAHDRDLSSSVLAYAQFLSCAEMNRAASAGGTLGILLPGLALSTAEPGPVFAGFWVFPATRDIRRRPASIPIRDSNPPQGRILKENLLVGVYLAVANACGRVNP
jgi:hypothetical protein